MVEWHFIDFSPVPQFVLDGDHRILRWNFPCEKLTGLKAKEMLGTRYQWKPFSTAPQPTLADYLLDIDPQKPTRIFGQNLIKMSDTIPGTWEMYLDTKINGILHNLHCLAAHVIDDNGNIYGVVESILDITAQRKLEQELKQSNEDYRTLAENFPEGFLVVLDGKLVLVNRVFASMLGYPSPDHITGMNAADLIAESHRDQFIINVESILSGESPLRKNQRPHLCRDGRLIWLEGHPRRISWRGRPALLSTLVDITENRQQELFALKKSSRLTGGKLDDLEFNVQDRYRMGHIIGKSKAMREVYSLVLKAAARLENVVIMGESGTGKEIVARTIHDLSSRSDCRFVPVNCGAIPAELLESEFFGYRKGAFTGAYTDKPGYLAEADQGTLFLDEVGELPLNMQVKLLRVLDNFTYSPLGESRIRKADIRVIAATNTNLLDLVNTGKMREDFFFRLYIIPICLPPLRDRKEDIPLLVDHFISEPGLASTSSSFMPGYVLDALYGYEWPGNVRELKNTIRRFLTLGTLDLVRSGSEKPGGITDPGDLNGSLKQMMDRYEARVIRETLRRTDGNRSRAAKILGIARKTFYRKIAKCNDYDTYVS